MSRSRLRAALLAGLVVTGLVGTASPAAAVNSWSRSIVSAQR